MELKTLCELNGASGDERLVRKALLEAAKEYTDDVKIDRMGNVIAHKKGTGKSKMHVCISAHMDEVGFIITGATEDGLLNFKPVGGIDSRVVVSKHVKVGPESLDGVIGAMAIHLQTREMRARVLSYDELYIDIGAKTKEEALSKCPLASFAYFASSYQTFGKNCVVAKALDDRVGCYNALKLLQNTYPCDITCAFVVQEEIGLRGALGAAFDLQADVLLNLEGTAAGDMGDAQPARVVCEAKKGVAISFMDTASIADRELFHTVLHLAEDNKILHQVKRGVTGGNDAGAYQRSKEGMKTLVLSVPCRYIHGPSSVCCLDDVSSQYELANRYLLSL